MPEQYSGATLIVVCRMSHRLFCAARQGQCHLGQKLTMDVLAKAFSNLHWAMQGMSTAAMNSHRFLFARFSCQVDQE